MNCAALLELAIPPSLKYIGSRAFLDCATLRRVVKLPGRHRWRGVYAEENTFAICPEMKWPPWLHMIPDMGYISGLGFGDPFLIVKRVNKVRMTARAVVPLMDP